jgi:hypothetical protein
MYIQERTTKLIGIKRISEVNVVVAISGDLLQSNVATFWRSFAKQCRDFFGDLLKSNVATFWGRIRHM